MKEAALAHPCALGIPFILNITSCLVRSRSKLLYTLGFVEALTAMGSIRVLRSGRSWGGCIDYQDRTRQEAESERHMDVTSESW